MREPIEVAYLLVFGVFNGISTTMGLLYGAKKKLENRFMGRPCPVRDRAEVRGISPSRGGSVNEFPFDMRSDDSTPSLELLQDKKEDSTDRR